jgi:long-chain fatty acid transport protein
MRNMKKITTAGAILLMTTSIATAGGLDRSGQGIGAIFEDGDYAELSFGSVSPSISGVGFATNFGGVGASSGNIANSYVQLGMAYKSQLNDQFSLAIIYDQPFGADVEYATPGYVLASPPPGVVANSGARVESDGITVLGRYEINPNFSVHGGLRYVQASGTYALNLAGYQSNYSNDGGFGYVIGGAYERDDIAMRIALTYSSGIDLELDGDQDDNTLTANLPESVNLDFQTGIAADTLLFGSVRYVAWDGFQLVDDNAATPSPILSYDADVYTYNIGVGRRLSDAFSASFAIGYEKGTGETTGNLGPTDGYISYQIGGAYTLNNGIEISGGVRYVDLGDAVTAPFSGDFSDNDAVAVGLKVAYNF